MRGLRLPRPLLPVEDRAARTVTSDGREPLRRAMNERMSRPEGRAIHRRRKAIVEPVFGQIYGYLRAFLSPGGFHDARGTPSHSPAEGLSCEGRPLALPG